MDGKEGRKQGKILKTISFVDFIDIRMSFEERSWGCMEDVIRCVLGNLYLLTIPDFYDFWVTIDFLHSYL